MMLMRVIWTLGITFLLTLMVGLATEPFPRIQATIGPLILAHILTICGLALFAIWAT